MTYVTCRLTAKNQDQLRNPTLGNRVWATFLFLVEVMSANVSNIYHFLVGRKCQRKGEMICTWHTVITNNMMFQSTTALTMFSVITRARQTDIQTTAVVSKKLCYRRRTSRRHTCVSQNLANCCIAVYGNNLYIR